MRGTRRAAGGKPAAPWVLVALGVAVGALQWGPHAVPGGPVANGLAPAATGGQGEVGKGIVMASEDDVAKAAAELQAAEQELQGKLTRSLPGGVAIAKPEVGQELKRLREDVEAKRRRLDQLRRE